MELSVIIPCYNAASTLAEQLEALVSQAFSLTWEVIVSDNGSTDETIVVAESFQSRLPHLRVIQATERRGAAHARNRGVAVARSEFLAFCDADDVVGDGYLQAVYDALKQHEFIACRYEFNKLNRRWIARLPGEHQQTDVDRGLLGPFAYAGGGSIAVRRRVHDAVGGFDENDFPILQDTDYCIRIQRAGVPLVFAGDAVVHYRWRTTARGAFSQARSWGRDLAALRMRYWPPEKPADTPASLLRHLLSFRRLRTREQLASWIWLAGWQLGSIEGWREQTRNRQAVRGGEEDGCENASGGGNAARHPAPGSRTKRLVLRAAGKVVLAAMAFRDRACGEVMREGFRRIDPTSILHYPLKIDGASCMEIGANVRIAAGSWLYAVTAYHDQVFTPEIQIDEGTSLGNACHLVATRKIAIGKNVVLGNRVYISDNLHDYREIHRSIAANKLLTCGEVHIGDGCRIEANACIIGDVRIGENCRIEPNAVVTSNLPPFSVAAGIPARVVRRYNAVSRRWEPTEPDGRFRGDCESRSEQPFDGFVQPDPTSS